MIKELRYVGTVSAQVVSVEVFGFTTVVRTLESVGPGTDLRRANRNDRKPASKLDTKSEKV